VLYISSGRKPARGYFVVVGYHLPALLRRVGRRQPASSWKLLVLRKRVLTSVHVFRVAPLPDGTVNTRTRLKARKVAVIYAGGVSRHRARSYE
jgi:hypothetical protein